MPTASGLSSSSGSHKSLPWTRCGSKWETPSSLFMYDRGAPTVTQTHEIVPTAGNSQGIASDARSLSIRQIGRNLVVSSSTAPRAVAVCCHTRPFRF